MVVDFWATWCGPCRASLPGLIKTHEQFHKQGFEVIGVSLDQDLDALGKFLDENKLPWVNLIGDKDGDEIKFPLAEKYEIQAIPTMFLVGKDGKVIARDLSEKELEKKLEELLGDEAKKSTGGSAAQAQTVARCGQGWLETIDGYPVLHLKGTPYEMGYQHGALLKESVRSNMHNILEVEGSTAIKLGPVSRQAALAHGRDSAHRAPLRARSLHRRNERTGGRLGDEAGGRSGGQFRSRAISLQRLRDHELGHQRWHALSWPRARLRDRAGTFKNTRC